MKSEFRILRVGAGILLYFAATIAPKKSGRPADGPEILTFTWLWQYGSPVLYFPANEARDLLRRMTDAEVGRWANSSRPRLLRFFTKRELHVLDRDSIPKRPMNLSLLSAEGISPNEVLVSDMGLTGLLMDLRANIPNRLPPCLVFELMDPVGSLELKEVLNFPHPHKTPNAADPAEYKQ
jgi:hypothetical protein